MGQSSSVSAVPNGNYLADLGTAELVYEKSLGQSRLLKAIRAIHRGSLGRVVVKVRLQGDHATYERYAKQLTAERDALYDVPNALPYQKVLSRDKTAYLLRQWVANNLYDRISTRPFLSLMEKKWIAFQLLTALRDVHSRNTSHGDIKSENILCTSSNWIYLSDFAPFKPTFLPLNDPADFAYFFDASGRRTCNLAPERFYDAKEAKPDLGGKVTEAMDVFALGCVIAEICSDGVSPFTLSQLFKYRMGEYTPNLARIEDESLKALIRSMLSLDPSQRLSSAEYLKDNAFPEVFFRLHPFLAEINDITAPIYNGESSTGPPMRTGADEKLERIWNDLDLVGTLIANLPQAPARTSVQPGLFPLTLNTPGLEVDLRRGAPKRDDPAALILLALLCANIRNCAWPSSIVRALDMLLALTPHLTDETRLDRVLPYMISVIDDVSALVRSAALRSVTQLLLLISTMTPSNAGIFSEYILPNVVPLATDTEILARTTFAQCLPSLAEVGARLLDLTRGMISTDASNDANEPNLYDVALQSLQVQIQEQAVAMLVDQSSAVKRALLRGLAPLCVFLGRTQTADVLLSHSITYLNDPDWALRAGFFEASVGLAACVGGKSVEQYILPLMMQALTDVEDAVVAQVLTSLTTLIEIGLVKKAGFWEIFETAAGLICHPTSWIRQGAASFIAAACSRILPAADVWCTLYPILRPLLSSDITTVDDRSILSAVLPPVPRPLLEAATAWAREAGRSSPYWKGSKSRSSDDIDHLQRLARLAASEHSQAQVDALRQYILKRAQKTQSPPAPESQGVDLLRGNVSLQSLGVTPLNVFYGAEKNFSLGKGPAPSRLHQVDNWPRRFPSSSPSASPHSRSASDANVVDDLRRRLALSGGSSSASLTSLSRQATATPPPLGESRRNSLAAEITSPEGMTSSQITIRPGPLATRPFSRAGGFEVGRVSPAIGSDTATALGTIDMDVRSPRSEDNVSSVSTSIRRTPVQHFSTTYEGHDPGIRNLLERTYLESAAEPMPEFGPRIVAGVPRKRAAKQTARLRADKASSNAPDGLLIAQMLEHNGAITSVTVSPDHIFFATGSDDGTVRVWDAMRLEKSATSRSRQILKHGERITAVCMLEKSHCIASASGEGSLMVHRVDVETTGQVPKYGKVQLIRQMAVEPAGDYITCMDHRNIETSSRLIYGTALATIAAVDLRTMRPLFSLQNAAHLGPISALLVEPKSAWVLVGTAEGHLSLWDLRFHLLVRSWKVAEGAVHRLVLHPSKGKGKWVIVAAELSAQSKTLLHVWDIDRCQLVERFATTLKANAVQALHSSVCADERKSAADAIADHLVKTEKSDLALSSVYELVVGTNQADLSASAKSTSSSGELVRPSLAYLLSSGDDQKVRYWDLDDIEHSACLVGGGEEAIPSYTTLNGSAVTQYLEVAGRRSSKRTPEEAQQARLRAPRDATTAIGVLELPYRCIVTGDRAGCVRVYT